MGGLRERGSGKARDTTAQEADKPSDVSTSETSKSREKKSPAKSQPAVAPPSSAADEAAALAELDQELKDLDEFCRQHELSLEEVQQALRPLVSAVNWSHTQQCAKLALEALMISLLVVGILVLILHQKPVTDAVMFSARIAMVKLRPYWDWSVYYKAACLISNPWFEDPKTEERSEDVCQSCESVSSLERLANVSAVEVTQNYLREDRPFVVTDATDDWPAMHRPDFDRHDLIQIFKNENLMDSHPCELKTNLKIYGSGMHVLISKMSNPVIKKWFAQWENCNKTASKALRTLYKRPYFLPAMIDTSDPNWVAISSNYTGHVYKMLPMVNDMVWMAQLQGTSQIRLVPRPPCGRLCTEISDTLNTGEILTFTDYMWTLEYVPGYGTDNIVIGTGGFWQ